MHNSLLDPFSLVLLKILSPIIFFIISLLLFSTAAKSLGYSSLLWSLASAFYFEPIVILYFLVSLSNKRLDKERKKEKDLVRLKIENSNFNIKRKSINVSCQTISDESTLI